MLVDGTNQMRLDATDGSLLKDPLQARQSPIQITIQQLKQEEIAIKQEPISMQQPPSYQEVIQNQGMRPIIQTQVQAPMMQQKMMPGNR